MDTLLVGDRLTSTSDTQLISLQLYTVEINFDTCQPPTSPSPL